MSAKPIVQWTCIFLVAVVTAVAAAFLYDRGCSWTPPTASPPEDVINTPAMINAHPEIPPPEITMPADQRPDDPAVAAFIDRALDVCRRGDYDGYRELFGSRYEPTPLPDFRRIWRQVASLEVLKIHRVPPAQPQFYLVENRVKLREKDRRGREEVYLPVMIFQESGQWRLGPVPEELRERLRASTRPATVPASEAEE